MRSRIRINKWATRGLAVACLAGASIVGVGGAASAAGSGSQTEYFYINSINDTGGVIAHGAFAAGGIDVSHNSADLLRLGNGRLVIHHPNSEATFTQSFDPATCFFTFTITGKYTLGNGTGAYANVTGSGTYRVSGEGVGRRNSDGSCSQNQAPKMTMYTVHGHGPVSMGSSG